MRRLTLALSLTLFVAACATTPRQPEAGQPPAVTPSPHARSSIVGFTAAELVSRFGDPALQVREGPGLKLQFRSSYCVLDAYLYPPASGSGATRVTYSDARFPSGADADQTACISALEARR